MTDQISDDLFQELYDIFGEPEQPQQPHEITAEQFAANRGCTAQHARVLLNQAVKDGKMAVRQYKSKNIYWVVK